MGSLGEADSDRDADPPTSLQVLRSAMQEELSVSQTPGSLVALLCTPGLGLRTCVFTLCHAVAPSSVRLARPHPPGPSLRLGPPAARKPGVRALLASTGSADSSTGPTG